MFFHIKAIPTFEKGNGGKRLTQQIRIRVYTMRKKAKYIVKNQNRTMCVAIFRTAITRTTVLCGLTYVGVLI